METREFTQITELQKCVEWVELTSHHLRWVIELCLPFFSFNGHNIVSQCVYQNLISTAFFRWHWNIKGVQLYWNRASAWVFSRKFAAYFQNTFSYKHVRRTASAAMSTSFLENNPNLYFLIGFYENNFPTFFFLFLTEHKFRSNIIILIL